jgi:hypothetical protein
MQNLIQLLEKTLVEARETKVLHAQQIEAMQATWEAKIEQDRVELLEDYEARLADLRHANEIDKANLEDDFKMLSERSEESRELLERVEMARAGVLPTENLPARMLFDKLAERWEFLTLADVEMIEAFLDRKVFTL